MSPNNLPHMSTREKLLAAIDAFLARHEMPQSQFGIEAMRDPSFVMRLRAGGQLRSDTIDKVEEFIRDYKQARPKMRPQGAAA
jgi:hypothetical protein